MPVVAPPVPQPQPSPQPPRGARLHVAVVGAGPAGIYTADILQSQAPGTAVDLFERLPAPFGLVRYGVAPDHPRVKKIVDALHAVLDRPNVRLFAGVEIGADLTVDELTARYDAVVVATGASTDAALDVPGVDLPGSFGAADFVSWYDGHPDRTAGWPLDAQEVAVVGAGNVALDITRMLVKDPEALAPTDVHDEVWSALRANEVRTVHLFARRGPAETRFSPKELRELGALAGVEVVVDPADVVLDDHARRVAAQSAQRRLTAETFTEWSARPPATPPAARRLHVHFYEAPAEILGTTAVTGIRTERTVPDGFGHVSGSGTFQTYPVQAVYRAVGYRSTPVAGLPFDPVRAVVPSRAGRVLDAAGTPVPGQYVTGWARRGPVGLIGSTRSDAAETVASVLADLADGARPAPDGTSAVEDLLRDRGTTPVDWSGWLRVDAAERALGEPQGRDRVKISRWTDLVEAATGRPAGQPTVAPKSSPSR